MEERAKDLNRRQTAFRITKCAQDLAAEHGLDGFTMDDVAACAGVSRRTLFNYVSGKLDAVLGAPPKPDPARLDEFRAGGPTGRLGDDAKIVIAALLDAKDIAPEDLERVRWFIASDARLFREMHDKFEVVANHFTEAILAREGSAFGELRARAAAQTILTMFDVALDAFVKDPSTSLVEYYLTAFDGAGALFT